MAICRGYGGAGQNRERSTHVGESSKACSEVVLELILERWSGVYIPGS